MVVQQIGDIIRRLKSEGFTILMVEQDARFAATVADRHYVMEGGRIIEALNNADIEANFDRVVELLGV